MRRVLLTTALAISVLAVWAGSLAAVAGSLRFARALDTATDLAHLGSRPQATVVLDRFERPAFSFYMERREDVPLDRVSPHMVQALLAVEDHRFFSHHGVDPARILKAAWRNWRAGRIVEGGSTITQQLARGEQLTPERTFARKILEAALATRLEDRYSKREILEAYLNSVYFGDGYYGVEAAAQGYFHKPAADLEPHEAALLAAIVRSPSGYGPTVAPARALARRNLVLRLMRNDGALSPDAYASSSRMPLPRNAAATVHAEATEACGRYFEEEVRRELVERFGSDRVMRDGLQVHTGYDPAMQCQGEQTIRARIAEIVKRRTSARDLQGSLVAIDPASGEVRAVVGGRDFAASSFNRATQARRQPGSAFKPIIYAAAVERGLAPASILRNLDQPIMTPQGPWLPGGEHERTEYTVRTALKLSSNRAAAQVLQEVGLSTAAYYAQRMGITSRLPSVPSLALGTGGVTLMELTSAYGVFANAGRTVSPHLITHVDDREGRIIWTATSNHIQAISPATAFLMNSMLADVLDSGTATPARAAGFTRPAGGKTGTTDDYADAWFIGYTPHLVAGVWFGMDKPQPIMSRGFAGVVAVPAWAKFMKAATAHDRADWFDVPADVEKVAVCPLSGKRATDACRHGWLGPDYVQAGLTSIPGAMTLGGPSVSSDHDEADAAAGPDSAVVEDYFPIGSAPSEYCTLHGGGALAVDDGAPGAAVPTAAPAGPVRTADFRVERVTRPDGTLHFVVRQR